MPKLILSDGASPHEPLDVRLIRTLIGGLLLAAATLKVLSSVESAALAVAYNVPPLLTGAVVQAEIALAVLLLLGCWVKRTLIVSAIVFGFFGMFSIYRGWTGYESCDCFGSIKVSPWITASLDGIMLLLAIWAVQRSSTWHQKTRAPRLYLAGSVYALAGLVAATGMIRKAPLALAGSSLSNTDGLVILDPESWIGEPFPLGPYLSPVVAIGEGRWTVLIYHHNCPRCQEAIPRYERLAAKHGKGFRNVLLIETPPFGSNEWRAGTAVRARLTDSQEWFVQTPVEIKVDTGIVVSASNDPITDSNSPP